MSILTDEEKANLSPEELAAIEGDEDSSSDLEEVASLEDGEGEESAEEESEEGEEEESGEAKPPIEGADDKTAEKTGDEPVAGKDKKEEGSEEGAEAESATEEESATTDFTPRMVAEDVSKLNEQLTAIADQKKALDAEFENGDIKMSDYMLKRDGLSSQETDVRVQIRQAEFASRQNLQTAEQRWEWEQDRFFEDHEVYKSTSKSFDPLMHAALDAAVKGLASNKDNEGKSGRWFLEEAHRQVSRRFKLDAAPNPDKKEGDNEEGKGKEAKGQEKPKPKTKAGTKPDLNGVPKTLSGIPAAEGNDAAESEFAALDKLTGIEYEEALARLTPEQQERYLKTG